jgi:oligopeptidase B
MLKPKLSTLLLGCFLLTACSGDEPPPVAAPESESSAPMAEQRPHELAAHGDVRVDEYFWLRDDAREDPEVLAYLEAENAWKAEVMAPQQTAVDALYAEMRARIKEDESSVPVQRGEYVYYSRYETGQQYPIIARRPANDEAADEQLLVDGNQRAGDSDYYRLANYEISPDGQWMAVAEDWVGRRQYRVTLRNLESGEWLETGVEDVTPALAWSADAKHIFYVAKDPVTLLPYKVMRHERGLPGEDVLVYEESDAQFYTTVYNTRSGEFIAIHMSSTLSDEVRLIDANTPTAEPRPFIARQAEHQYSIDHAGGADFYVRSNLNAPNYHLIRTTLEQANDPAQWEELLAHRQDALLESVQVFDGMIAVGERSGGLRRIRLLDKQGGMDSSRLLNFDEPAFTAWLGNNPEPSSTTLRYNYTSMTTPMSVYQYDPGDDSRTLLKQDPVLGDFNSADYASRFLMIEARDGTMVPVSLVHHKNTPLDGTAPLYQYAYGSYGSSSNPSFSSTRLSLLDRGVVYAIAHVRGGQEMGRAWYDQGRMLNKWNTFYDFIDVTRGLVQQGLVDGDRVVAMGGSAGGLLMGAVANTAPQDYRALVAHVPFVDVVTTMLDESIPLTTGEYNEWGNPNDPQYYEYMLSYSPYDNVSAQDYPNMLVTTGLHDSQVQYWEPAKWVARLRANKTDDNELLLKTNMSAGHGGASGRFSRLEELAFEYAWVLKHLGLEAAAQQ